MKLYEYHIDFYNNKKVEATIREHELIAENETQYVYEFLGKYYIQDKKDYDNKNNLCGGYYSEGFKYCNIPPHFTVWLYTKKLSKANENKVKAKLEELVKEKFGFIESLEINIEFAGVSNGK